MNQFKFRAENMDSPQGETPAPDNSSNGNPDTGGTDPSNPKPDVPVITDPDHPTFPVTYKRGDCSKDSYQVISCMDCQIKMKSVAVPMSKKAIQLLKTMEQGCQVPNKSDPAGYIPPSSEIIMAHLNRATEALYPTTPSTVRQQKHLALWSNGDSNSLKQLFGGLWYHPPFSDDFETYFGLEPREARYMFCYGTPDVTFNLKRVSPMYSINYYQCIQEHGEFGFCRENVNYIKANGYRKELINSIRVSLSDPANEEEMVPANKCHWETMSGLYNVEMENKLMVWKNAGYDLAVYFDRDNPRCEKVQTASIPLNARVIIAGKHCTEF